MAFDGLFLYKMSLELNILTSGKINRIIDTSDTDFIFNIRANKDNYNLLISLNNDYSRIHLTAKHYDAPKEPKGFTMLLRKHFEGSVIEEIKSYNTDRILIIKCRCYNEMQDKSNKYIILELMGRYSNLIILNDDFEIIDSYKREGISENSRTLLPHAKFEFLETKKFSLINLSIEDIIKIVEEKNIDSPKDYLNYFNGLSNSVVDYIYNSKCPYIELYNLVNSNISPNTFLNKRDKLEFHFFKPNFNIINTYSTLSIMLDDFYYEADRLLKIKQKTNDLASFVKKQINKYELKILKLEKDLNDATNNDIYRLYGELLLANLHLKYRGTNITLLNYYDNKEINIPLDEKFDLKNNANRYFKKYHKSKTAITHINEQINASNDEIKYFKVLETQINYGSLNDILEIQEELIELKYINKQIKKNKKNKPKLLTYILNDNTKIIVGKNNTQNEYLTHTLAKPNEMWFHVKDGPGSHVIVRKQDNSILNEYEIRTAANISAYYSFAVNSSSVAVNYTLIKNIKKIPGKRNCFVTISNEKTIYIDPSKDLIDKLMVEK